MGEVQEEAESVGSDVGGTIPPLQGTDLPAAADAGMYMSEEFRRTVHVHAWHSAAGTSELPVQSVVSSESRSGGVGQRCRKCAG